MSGCCSGCSLLLVHWLCLVWQDLWRLTCSCGPCCVLVFFTDYYSLCSCVLLCIIICFYMSLRTDFSCRCWVTSWPDICGWQCVHLIASFALIFGYVLFWCGLLGARFGLSCLEPVTGCVAFALSVVLLGRAFFRVLLCCSAGRLSSAACPCLAG